MPLGNPQGSTCLDVEAVQGHHLDGQPQWLLSQRPCELHLCRNQAPVVSKVGPDDRSRVAPYDMQLLQLEELLV